MTSGVRGSSYCPRPGTGAARCIAELEALRPGESLSGSDLADLCGVNASSVAGLLLRPIESGFVIALRDGSRVRYAIHAPDQVVDEREQLDEAFVHRIVPASETTAMGLVPQTWFPSPPDLEAIRAAAHDRDAHSERLLSAHRRRSADDFQREAGGG